MEYKDYYQILGVERSASREEIKRAYRKLARKFHPDVSTEADAESQFKEIGEAYEVLGDAEKRQAYDELGSNWNNGQSFQPPPDWQGFFNQNSRGSSTEDAAFSDFFDSLFTRSQFHQSASFKGRDRQANIEVTLEQLFAGQPISVSLDSTERQPNGQYGRKTRKLKVNLPKGIGDGESFRLKGQGEPGTNGGDPGDLYITLNVANHPHFTLSGKDVHSTLKLEPWEAVLGTQKTVMTLGGSVKLKIPAESRDGKKLRLKNRGLNGGNHVVTINIDLPESISEDEKKLYEQLAALHQKRGATI